MATTVRDIIIRLTMKSQNFEKNAAKAKTKIEAVTRTLEQQSQAFSGWALSLLFFGMQLQAVFTGIAKFGVKTFQEVQHQAGNLTTNVDVLSGSMKFLGFSIGEAMEPVLGFLIPIVDRVAIWVSENEKLVAAFITLGTTIGSTFFVGGSLVLGLQAIGSTLATIALRLTTVGAGFAAIGAGPLAAVGLVLAGIVTALLLLNKHMDENPLFKEKFKSGVLQPLLESFDRLKATLLDLVNSILEPLGIRFESLQEVFQVIASVAITNFINKLTTLIEVFSILLNVVKISMTPLLTLFKAISQAIDGDFEDAFKTLSSVSIDKELQSIQDSFANIGRSVTGSYEANILAATEPSGNPVTTQNVTNYVTIDSSTDDQTLADLRQTFASYT